MKLFCREYDEESLYDLPRDLADALDPAFNLKLEELPKDENGYTLGTFKVTIEWVMP